MSDFIKIVTVDPIKSLLESQPDFAIDMKFIDNKRVYAVSDLDCGAECLIENENGVLWIKFTRLRSKRFENRIRKCLKPIIKESEEKNESNIQN